MTHSADDGLPGSLRYEIVNATANETITIAPEVSPTLAPNGHISIGENITLVGQGMAQTTISATGHDRAFTLDLISPGTVTIKNLSITGGHAPTPSGFGTNGGDGGAILGNSGNLVLDGVDLFDNAAGAANNGANGSSGSTGNPGGDGGSGGAISSEGPVAVLNSVFSGNAAGRGGTGGIGGDDANAPGAGGLGGHGGDGGAIFADGPASISNTTFSDNHAGAGGNGGLGGTGGVTGAAGGHGGSGGIAGGLEQSTSTPELPIVGSTFAANTAGAGGTGGNGTGITAGAQGGSGGTAGGAMLRGADVLNSSFADNSAGAGGAGGNNSLLGQSTGGPGGIGGGIVAFGTVDVHASTVAFNSTGPGGPQGGASYSGGGIISLFASNQIDDSIIADNAGAGSMADPDANCAGGVPTDTTFDLSFPAGTGCPGMTGDPHLAALADNGGPTQTLALGTGSAAIDKIPTTGAGCPATDQRGVTRPIGSACDIGAFEAPLAPPVTATPPATATPPVKKCKKKKRKHHAAAARKKSKKHCRKKKKKPRSTKTALSLTPLRG